MYEYYNVAKKALGKGNAACQTANEIATQIEAGLASAATLATQIKYLRDSLQEQLQTLYAISEQITKEETASKDEFDGTIRELDVLDGELNTAITNLRSTRMPGSLAPGSLTSCASTEFSTKTLFEFADDAAVDTLKGQLRQIIDDMQEFQEEIVALSSKHLKSVQTLEKTILCVKDAPVLRVPGSSDSMLSKASPSMATIAARFTRQQEDHLHQMAKLLVSLSQHYDHSSTLFKSETSLPLEELEELQNIVEHDAEQLEDVLTELDERVVDLEEDLAAVTEHVEQGIVQQNDLIRVFEKFELFPVDEVETNLSDLLKNRAVTMSQLEILKQQLICLSNHYNDFALSYNALLVEIDRRARYEATISTFLQQTNQTLARLALDESGKRDQFIRDHCDSLPGDIWQGITDRPDAIAFDPVDSHIRTPRLPRSAVEAAQVGLRDA